VRCPFTTGVSPTDRETLGRSRPEVATEARYPRDHHDRRSCLVLITSRNRLDGLIARDGARRVALDVLTPAEATTLLARFCGPSQLTAEPWAATELARLCGYLPLVLRIAAVGGSTCSPSRTTPHRCAPHSIGYPGADFTVPATGAFFGIAPALLARSSKSSPAGT
jgi:hypothetical protein